MARTIGTTAQCRNGSSRKRNQASEMTIGPTENAGPSSQGGVKQCQTASIHTHTHNITLSRGKTFTSCHANLSAVFTLGNIECGLKLVDAISYKMV